MKNTMDELEGIFLAYGKFAALGGPVAGEVIEAAEKQLNVNFPRSCRDFLLRFGCLNFSCISVAGIHPDSTAENVRGSLIIDNVIRRKDGGYPPLADEIIFTMNEDEADIVIDAAQMDGDEAPIYRVELGNDFY